MKLKNEIFANEVFERSLQSINAFDGYDIKTSLKIYKIAKELGEHKEAYDSQEAKLIKKYGDEIENGFEISSDKIPLFEKELKELQEIEVDLSFDKMIFPEVEIKLSPMMIHVLKDVFIFDGLDELKDLDDSAE